MEKNVMWLLFVFIFIGIVLTLQRKNIIFFPKGGQIGGQTTQSPSYQTPTPTATPGTEPKSPLRINIANVYSDKAAAEYIIVDNTDFNQKQSVKISGLRLKNKDNFSAVIGKDEYNNDIALNYSERAIINTGESPVGKNFKVNKCSGYFSQSNKFNPSIYTSCPAISDLPQPRNLDDKCIGYIENLSRCTMPVINYDTGINNDCTVFVNEHASYTGCVADHKNDKDFDQREWRIYLGQPKEIWANRHDIIQLLDPSGKLVTETSY